MVQKLKNEQKNQHIDLSTQILKRESKEKLFSKKWSKAILKDVSLYNNPNSKIIKVTISSTDESYQDDFIIDKYSECVYTTDITKVYESLVEKKGKYISIGYLNKGKNIIRIDKSVEKSKTISLFEEGFKHILPYLIGSTLWAIQTLASIRIYEMFSASLGSLYVAQILILFISATSYQLMKYRINKNHFEIKQPDNMHEILDENNIVKNNVENISIRKGIIKSYRNGKIMIKNKNTTWTFEPENGVISNDILEFYTKYGGQFDHNDTIPILVYSYNNTTLTDDQYLSDCGGYILEPYVI